MTDEREDVMVFYDEEGEQLAFQHLDTIELNGNTYVVVTPLESDEESDEEDEEIIILKVDSTNIDEVDEEEEGEATFVNVEDEEADEVYEEYCRRCEEDYELQ